MVTYRQKYNLIWLFQGPLLSNEATVTGLWMHVKGYINYSEFLVILDYILLAEWQSVKCTVERIS